MGENEENLRLFLRPPPTPLKDVFRDLKLQNFKTLEIVFEIFQIYSEISSDEVANILLTYLPLAMQKISQDDMK